MRNDSKSKSGGDKRPRKPGGFNANKSGKPTQDGEKRYNFRDNPKTFNNSGQSSDFGAKRPDSKPHVSKFDSNDRYGAKNMDNNRPARSFDGDKPKFERGGDRPERKPYGDRPPRSFDNDKPRFDKGGDRLERKSFDDRRPRSFDSEKPRFDKAGDRPERKTFGDRPPRSFDSEKPRFDKAGDRPERKTFVDRPPRSFDGDKPQFDRRGDRPERKSFDDRPPRKFDSEKPRFDQTGDRPERKPYGDRPPRSFDDRPKRDFNVRPDRKSFDNRTPRFENRDSSQEQNPIEPRPDKFANDKSRFAKTPGRASRPAYEPQRTPRGPKRFDGPYQKNLNSDTGGGSRSDRGDKYRSDGAHFDYESRLKETIEEKNGTIRLNRFIANSGICSRRDADELILAGQITVNGEVITEMGHQVKGTDAIKYGNKLLSREKMVYLLLNKPKDYITTTEDPQERKTVMKLIEGACKERIYPVGRLDRNTTGLLLFTNDGELASKLTHPSNNVEKMYQVELDKPITEEHYQQILKGVTLEDGEIKADSFGIVTPDAMVVGIQIHSGRNHIVRRIFAHLGYEVLKLDRTVFAGLNKKDLPRSNYRMLTEKEVIKLKYLS